MGLKRISDSKIQKKKEGGGVRTFDGSTMVAASRSLGFAELGTDGVPGSGMIDKSCCCDLSTRETITAARSSSTDSCALTNCLLSKKTVAVSGCGTEFVGGEGRGLATRSSPNYPLTGRLHSQRSTQRHQHGMAGGQQWPTARSAVSPSGPFPLVLVENCTTRGLFPAGSQRRCGLPPYLSKRNEGLHTHRGAGQHPFPFSAKESPPKLGRAN
jgi:hypothetical protein